MITTLYRVEFEHRGGDKIWGIGHAWVDAVNADDAMRQVGLDGRRSIKAVAQQQPDPTDFDYPGTATTFGWCLSQVQRCLDCGRAATGPVPNHGTMAHCPHCDHAWEDGLCDHEHTDGTVDCPDCGVTASEFISAAGDWLREHDGETADDPGYFDGE